MDIYPQVNVKSCVKPRKSRMIEPGIHARKLEGRMKKAAVSLIVFFVAFGLCAPGFCRGGKCGKQETSESSKAAGGKAVKGVKVGGSVRVRVNSYR
jgi:hypothetical protein